MGRYGLLIAAALLAAGTAHAQPTLAEKAAHAAAKPAPASAFLPPEALSPAATLPPPPADGSPKAVAELAELHRIEAARAPERLAQARHDAEVEDVRAFGEVIGPGFDLARLPATKRLFDDLRHEDSAAAKRAKNYFLRTRPWAADPSLQSCDRGDAVKSSYPSGHATMAYAAAGILVRLDPAKAQAYLARASDYSESRLVCGAHYRADIEGGQVLGTLLAARLMETPAFQAEFAAAEAELRQAGLVR